MNSHSLTWTMLLSGKITNTLAVRLEGEALPNKTLDKFKSFQRLLADLQEHPGLQSVIPMLRFALVPKHSRKTSHIS